jgi:hypothetical protein
MLFYFHSLRGQKRIGIQAGLPKRGKGELGFRQVNRSGARVNLISGKQTEAVQG